jgi:hypothetical protein
MLIHEPEPIPQPMSKKDMIEQLRQRLASKDRWALRALMRIYQNQTADEQNSETTIERNGIGFTGPYAEILSSFARQYQRRGSLSERQMIILRRRIPAYARQIVQCTDTTRFEHAFCGTCYTHTADSQYAA